jgi:hypothetical protein
LLVQLSEWFDLGFDSDWSSRFDVRELDGRWVLRHSRTLHEYHVRPSGDHGHIQRGEFHIDSDGARDGNWHRDEQSDGYQLPDDLHRELCERHICDIDGCRWCELRVCGLVWRGLHGNGNVHGCDDSGGIGSSHVQSDVSINSDGSGNGHWYGIQQSRGNTVPQHLRRAVYDWVASDADGDAK